MIKRLLEKYKRIPVGAKAALWFTVCNIVQKGISLLTTPIFTRLLTTEQYGEFTLYSSWYQVISIFATLNLFYGVYNNGMTKFPEDRARFTSSLQGLSTVITLLLLCVYMVGIEFWNCLFGLSTLYMLTMFVELLVVPAFNFWSAGQRYDYRYKALITVTLIIALTSPLLGFIAVLNTTHKAEARVLTIALVQIIVGLVFYIINMLRGRIFFHKGYWKYALMFNIPLIPHYLSSMVLGHADRIMIGSMVGKSEAALYAVAYNIALMMNIVISAINSSFTPFMYQSIKSKEYAPFRKITSLLVLLVGTISVIGMTVGPELIWIIGSEEYADAMWVIPPVAGATFFMFLYPIFSNVEFYYDKTRYIMVASCVSATLNIMLNYWLIPIFGYHIAGYTTLFCYIVYTFSHYYFARGLCEKEGIGKLLFDIRYILLISIGVMVAIIILPLLYPHLIVRAILCMIEVTMVSFLGMRYLRVKK